jgi:hypothetical protein
MLSSEGLKSSNLDTFVPNYKSVSIPIKNFHPVAYTVKKDEKASGGGFLAQDIAHHAAESFKRLSHVSRIPGEEDFEAGRGHPHVLALLFGKKEVSEEFGRRPVVKADDFPIWENDFAERRRLRAKFNAKGDEIFANRGL